MKILLSNSNYQKADVNFKARFYDTAEAFDVAQKFVKSNKIKKTKRISLRTFLADRFETSEINEMLGGKEYLLSKREVFLINKIVKSKKAEKLKIFIGKIVKNATNGVPLDSKRAQIVVKKIDENCSNRFMSDYFNPNYDLDAKNHFLGPNHAHNGRKLHYKNSKNPEADYKYRYSHMYKNSGSQQLG